MWSRRILAQWREQRPQPQLEDGQQDGHREDMDVVEAQEMGDDNALPMQDRNLQPGHVTDDEDLLINGMEENRPYQHCRPG